MRNKIFLVPPKTFFYGRVISVAHLFDSAIQEIDGDFTDAQLVRVDMGWCPTTQDTQSLVGKMSIKKLILETRIKGAWFHLSSLLSYRTEAIAIGVKSLMNQHD